MKKLLAIFFLLVLVGCNNVISSTEPVVLNTEEYLNLSLYHNVNVNHDPFIELEDNVVIYKYYVDNQEIDKSKAYYEDGFIYFEYGILNDLEVGGRSIVVYSDRGIINVDLNLVDDEIPYIVGDNNITYISGSDIVVLIETFNEGISSISTTGDFSEDDYSFSGRELVINSEFIEAKILENEERTNIIFLISVNYNSTDVLILGVNVILE